MTKKATTPVDPQTIPTEVMTPPEIDLSTAEIIELPTGVSVIVKPLTASNFWEMQRTALEGGDQIAALQSLIMKMFMIIDTKTQELKPITMLDLDPGEGVDSVIGFQGCAFLWQRGVCWGWGQG